MSYLLHAVAIGISDMHSDFTIQHLSKPQLVAAFVGAFDLCGFPRHRSVK